MALRPFGRIALSCVVALSLYMAAAAAAPAQEAGSSPLALGASRVSIAGTSNIHAYAASTTALRVTRVKWANTVAGPTFWDELVKPGALEVFAIAIPAATLVSETEGLGKNITFRLLRLEPRAGTANCRRCGFRHESGHVELWLSTQFVKNCTKTMIARLRHEIATRHS